ncbi:unnamed protein product [Rotaria sp. Silwood1]|nr:unnamed protein product [Rotaria sp. Silwood1]CAF3458265.1 unnamed protein product [Rotaria sp. Silwood1]CAF4792949.1 unnamed protein product [Rotaria sp. Silwood1]
MLLRHHGWKQVVKTKTKRSTVISILRWTLLRRVTQSLDQINDEDTKKNILWEEMYWLNQYWTQSVPKSSIAPKYWQRLFITKSLNTRRDLYEYLSDEATRRERFRCRMDKRKEIIAAISDSNRWESPFHRTIFATLDMKYNPQRGFEFAHVRQSYFSSLFQKVFRCFKHIDRFHSPAYIIITVRQNIRHQKLPLEKYFTFHSTSSRALAFHEIYNILLTLKHTNNNWIKAFYYVSKRKIATRIEEEELDDDDEKLESVTSC